MDKLLTGYIQVGDIDGESVLLNTEKIVYMKIGYANITYEPFTKIYIDNGDIICTPEELESIHKKIFDAKSDLYRLMGYYFR